MPAMQRIADQGRRVTNAHVTPPCTSTRSCLLTGMNRHRNQMFSVPRFSQGFRAHDSENPPEHGFMSQILLEEDDATLCVGKWHLTGIEWDSATATGIGIPDHAAPPLIVSWEAVTPRAASKSSTLRKLNANRWNVQTA